MKRNILTIFLASPGNLIEERKAVRSTVDRVNKIISRRVGWSIELLGWEDTLPSFNRPQELINKDVDSCELFIGVLWQRWGQDTCKYSSGFEEEFIRATNRRKNTGRPEIWLFFKSIDAERLNDPGDQLKKVLEFREDQVKKKELLFKKFENSAHWAQIIHDDILAYVLDLSTVKPEAGQEEQSVPIELQQQDTHEKQKRKQKLKETYSPELANLLANTSNDFKEGKKIEIGVWDATRIYLQASVWFSEAHIGEVFGNHEINLVYVKRNEWNLSNEEKWFILRTFLCDAHSNRPGWFWLKQRNEKQITSMLIWLSLYDNNEIVQKGAAKLIADSGIDINKNILQKWTDSIVEEIVLSAVEIIKTNNKIDCYELLEPLTTHENEQIKNAAIQTKIEFLYRDKPNDAFLFLTNFGSSVPQIIEKTIDKIDIKVNHDLLYNALEKANSAVRLFCAKYLRKANLLSKEKCKTLFKDPDDLVRKEGLLKYIDLENDINMEFIKKLFPVPPEQKTGLLAYGLQTVRADEFLPLILNKRQPDELLSELDLFQVSGVEAYRILALNYFQLIKGRIRSDLNQNFESLRKESESRFINQYGEGAELYLKNLEDKTIQFLKDRFVSAALEGLSKNGKKSDIKFARKYLNNTDFNIADNSAIEIIRKYGDSSDVESLLRSSSNTYGETSRNAAEVAYLYTSNKGNFIKRMLSSENSNFVDIGLKILSKSKIPNKIKIAKTLLKNDKDEIRIKGLSIIFKKYSIKELEKFLTDYTKQKTYYYNVVTWIDRCLYSKGQYRKFFHGELKTKV